MAVRGGYRIESDRQNVGILWPPGTQAHIHSHSYNGFGKNIEGRVEVFDFDRTDEDHLRLTERSLMDAGTLMRLDGSRTIHAVRNVSGRDAIDMHFYGPDLGHVAERFEPGPASCSRTCNSATSLPSG